ncbi:DoxX family protein [Streptomyces iconiensis]|uniref:DoxX family membrane protein n=1 Tax=Streptomyces iconiensis TaxID=1384038 RepID=A0ABT7A3B9_9ACTN|nr:DoxX family membrane protein [Streptomyces iconiensis]MDJ1135817.1 DoxX family membrane protein [Streptomyces iconiensis]
MSVDTRTPRAPGAPGRSPGGSPGASPRGFFDDEPVLSTVKVPSDPAEVVVSHASFRVRLGSASAAAPPGTPPTPVRGARHTTFEDTAPLPAVTGHAPTPAQGGGNRRRAPVVWSGHAGPEDTGATRLLQAVRTAGGTTLTGTEPAPADSTQALPRVNDPAPQGRPGPATVVGPPRSPQPSEAEPLLSGVRPTRGAYDEPYETGELETVSYEGEQDATGADDRRRRDGVRHAYYPGRRMNLGVVLLPLRVFLGFITVYAGMGKLCDPVYFDGGRRGSMVTWLRSLDPWTIASPLRDFALAHPVGSGLTVAFLQVIVGVLTMFGLWQRVAASLGALLSAALLMTVSWSTVPAYDAPDIIYLAAWSPLIIAGAPVYSVDGRLASEAWRRLGPRVEIGDLRRRVLRRGTVLATVIVGLALLVGSLLGSAVRSSQTATVPERGETPTNRLPGSPLPEVPGDRATSGQASQGPGATGTPGERQDRRKKRPSSPAASPGEQRATSGPETTPSQGQGQAQPRRDPAAQQSAPPQQQRTPQQAPTATGGTTAGPESGAATSSSSANGGGGSSSDGGGSSSGGGGGGSGALGGLLG